MEKNLVCMEENVQKDGTVSFVTAQRQVSLVQRVEGVSLSHIFDREYRPCGLRNFFLLGGLFPNFLLNSNRNYRN